MPKYHIQTYGCQMNYSDTERMETYLQTLGYKKVDELEKADLIIFNTCSVRQKAENRVTGQMRTMEKLKKKNKNLIVIIAGCMARKSSSRYSSARDTIFNRIKEIDIVLKTEHLPRLGSLIREINPEIPEIKQEKLKDHLKIQATHTTCKSNTQALLPISNGCDKFCTYCIVPYSRGREKSRKSEEILKEAEELVENGCKEITLIGQTVNSYGLSQCDKENKDLKFPKGKEPFVYLLEQLDKLYGKGLRRVRFTSPHPKDMSNQLIDAMATLRTQMPYLHLPLQAGDNKTLKRMNRPYTIEQYYKIIEKLRKKIPDISISTDIIVGFCGETEKEFQNTCKFFRETRFEHAYISQYSERKGTTSARFIKDDIPPKTKKKRWVHLNDMLRKQSGKTLKKFIGKTVEVLVESQKGKECAGRDKHSKAVKFHAGRPLIGQIVPVKITSSREWVLEGELL